MRWAAQFKHHVVGNIHQSGNAALATTRQAVHHPWGCLRLGIDIADNTTRETTAQIRGADRDFHGFCVVYGNRWEFWLE